MHNCLLGELNPLEAVTAVSVYKFSIAGHEIIVSNHMVMITAATLLLLILLPLGTRTRSLVPTGLRNMVESICVFLREEVARPILGGHTDQYIGFVWTVFFFILALNLLAMVPTEKMIYLITRKENHLGGSATANIWVTGALAIITFFMTHISGIRQYGFWTYLAHLAPPVPWWMKPFIFALEIISTLVRPFALAIRLFANMLAGHTLLATLLGLIFVFKSYGVTVASILGDVLLSLMELFVAILQAYIFTLLSVLYIGFSIEPEH